MKILLAIAVALLGMAQDVDNPQFKYWTSCKPGSWVKMKMEMAQGAQKFEGETTNKLVEIKDDLVVVEISGKSKVAGQEYPLPVQKQEIKAKEPAEKIKILKEGDEEIEVAGKKLKCHWIEFSGKSGEQESKGKVWLANEIPGGMAKMETSSAKGMSIQMTAVEWEKK